MNKSHFELLAYFKHLAPMYNQLKNTFSDKINVLHRLLLREACSVLSGFINKKKALLDMKENPDTPNLLFYFFDKKID